MKDAVSIAKGKVLMVTLGDTNGLRNDLTQDRLPQCIRAISISLVTLCVVTLCLIVLLSYWLSQSVTNVITQLNTVLWY
jgi:hypothetical protein